MKLKQVVVMLVVSMLCAVPAYAGYVTPEAGYTPSYSYVDDVKWDSDQTFAIKKMGVDVSEDYIYFTICTNYKMSAPPLMGDTLVNPGDLLISVGDSYYNLHDTYADYIAGDKSAAFKGEVYGLGMWDHSIYGSMNVQKGVIYSGSIFKDGWFENYEILNYYYSSNKTTPSPDKITPYPEDPFDDDLNGAIDVIKMKPDGVTPDYDANGNLQYVSGAVRDNDKEINTLPTVIKSYTGINWNVQSEYGPGSTNIREVANVPAVGADYFNDYTNIIEGWIPIDVINARGKTVELWWSMMCGNDGMTVTCEVPNTPVPEPITMVMVGSAALGLIVRRKLKA